MKIVGLDLSLTATGLADDDGTHVLRVPLPKHASEQQRATRLRGMGQLVDRRTRDADLVVLEGPAFGASNSHQHSLGELSGVVKVCLLQRGVTFVSVVTQHMKKFATGKGNADKDMVLSAAVRVNPEISNNNEADAYWLRCMGLAHYEQRDFVLPEYRRDVLTVIGWPELEERTAVVG